MIFKPPYWYHDNIKFSDDDLKILKYEIDGLREKKFAKEKQHISTFFLEKYEQSINWLNKYLELKGESGIFSDESIKFLELSNSKI